MADISKIKLPNNAEYLFKDIKALSRGEQLVTNGTGMIGDNTNFSNWTFDGSKANSSAGSFTRTGGYANIGTDDFFPVNANEKYKFEFDLMSLNNTGTMYAMLLFYDVDKKSISAGDIMFYSGTLTTLTQELKAGDTVVHLASVANYQTYGTGSHQRALTFWDYSNSFGYLYPPETYSRNHLWSAWADNTSIDTTNNTITLATAYTGATKPAGTYVSQGNSGSTYKYSGIIGGKVPTTWTHYTGYFDGTDYSGKNKYDYFPPASAYCKVGFLWNYNSANDQFWTTNISVKEVPKEAKIADSVVSVNEFTLSSDVTGSTVDNFKGTTIKAAKIGSISIPGLVSSDGTIIWIPWSATYGRQLIFDDTTHKIFSRYLSNGTWGTWVSMAVLNKADTNALINTLDTGTSTPEDADYYISQFVGGGTTTTTYHRRPMSALWAYIKSKIESIVLSTSTSSTSTTTAATSSAVKTAYDLADSANTTAGTALSGVNGTLYYDHTYTISNGIAVFTAHVYCKGTEVTDNYQDSAFSWSYRIDNDISGTPTIVSLGTGKTKNVTISTLGYGGHVIGTFTTPD